MSRKRHSLSTRNYRFVSMVNVPRRYHWLCLLLIRSSKSCWIVVHTFRPGTVPTCSVALALNSLLVKTQDLLNMSSNRARYSSAVSPVLLKENSLRDCISPDSASVGHLKSISVAPVLRIAFSSSVSGTPEHRGSPGLQFVGEATAF